MGFIERCLLRVNNPFTEFKRFRGKINIQRPRPPFFLRQLVEDFTKPKFAKCEDNIKLCGHLRDRIWLKPDNPFERIVAKECANWFHNSHMIVFLHLNSASLRDRSEVFSDLRVHNMHLRIYGRKIAKMAIEDTPYAPVLSLFESYNNVIFSEKVQITKVVELIQKCRALIVMAAIVDGKLLSKDEFMKYSKIKSIEEVQSELCHVLDMSALNVTNQLMQHPQSLVTSLDSYVSLKESEAEKQKSCEETNVENTNT